MGSGLILLLIVGLGMWIPSSWADGCASSALSRVSDGVLIDESVCFPPMFTSIRLSPSLVCGTSRVSSGDFRSQSG